MGMMFRFKSSRSILFWILISLGLLTAGCGPALADIQTPKPNCLPASGGGLYDFPVLNIQARDIETITNKIFYGACLNDQLKARREALRFLQIETKRWSYFQDEGENNTRVRTIITFITPELVQAVILNQVLARPNFQTINLGSYMQENFDKLKKRNELIFLLTFLPASDQGDNSFSVPPERILLHNTSKLEVQSSHSDDFLNGTLKFSDKSQSGFIFFPLGVNESGKENDCSRVLDPERDTSLMLNITNATIGARGNQTISWHLPYTSLLLADGIPFEVDCTIGVQSGEESIFSPLAIDYLPQPNFGNAPDDIFWREYGRFIWGKLTSTFK